MNVSLLDTISPVLLSFSVLFWWSLASDSNTHSRLWQIFFILSLFTLFVLSLFILCFSFFYEVDDFSKFPFYFVFQFSHLFRTQNLQSFLPRSFKPCILQILRNNRIIVIHLFV